MNAAIFLDRDGVIIENRSNYVRQWADVEIYPQALDVLARISHLPYKVILVTNQSVVGRGIISLEDAQEINQLLVEQIHEAGGRIDGVYMCPHAPADNCSCRKPKPGLLRQAAADLELDLDRSLMIGDALTDVMAGQAAGVEQAILLLTGRGQDQAQLPEALELPSFLTYDTLADALSQYPGLLR